MLFAVDLHKNFINIEGIAITSVLSLQSAGINGTKSDAPETDRFSTDCDASLSQEVFDISMAKIEAIIEPDGITDDVRREPVMMR